MQLTWFGHAAFLIETQTPDGTVRIITDPFSSQTGYAPINESADVVTLSHENPKYHSCLTELQGQPEIVQGLEIVGQVVETHGLRIGAVPVFESYDFEQRKGEGPNTMIWLESEGLRVLHMGDVGHRLDDTSLAACGPVDILLAPTGGKPTIGLADLQDFIHRLQPRLVLPMHYGTAKVDMKILPIGAFTALFSAEQVQHVAAPTLVVSPDELAAYSTPQIRVLQHAR
ncbi:MAG: MBL fold metallo-hydrolase [Abitibacteriaceae bacterium]|nr:MBL fold metallo-hydrolase [Abditibacteriaceae bacterium]